MKRLYSIYKNFVFMMGQGFERPYSLKDVPWTVPGAIIQRVRVLIIK